MEKEMLVNVFFIASRKKKKEIKEVGIDWICCGTDKNVDSANYSGC